MCRLRSAKVETSFYYGRYWIALALVVGCLAGINCDPVDPGAAGVQTNDMRIVIAAKPCRSSMITSVKLIRTGSAGDVLWSIEAPGGSTLNSYVVGVTPAGFEQRTALQEEPAPGTRYVIALGVTQSKGPITLEFDPAELNDNSWITNLNKRLNPDAFDRLKGC